MHKSKSHWNSHVALDTEHAEMLGNSIANFKLDDLHKSYSLDRTELNKERMQNLINSGRDKHSLWKDHILKEAKETFCNDSLNNTAKSIKLFNILGTIREMKTRIAKDNDQLK